MDVTDVALQVAGEVRAWLARRQISANQAAQSLGWSQTYLSRRLTGSQRLSVEDLIALGELLEVPPTAFFDTPDEALMKSRKSPIERHLGKRNYTTSLAGSLARLDLAVAAL